jgi:hypothetical protein
MKTSKKFNEMNDRSPTRDTGTLDQDKILEQWRTPSQTKQNAGSEAAQRKVDEVFGCPTVVGKDGTVYLKGHISNVPEVSKGLQSIDDVKAFGIGVGHGLKKMGQETLEYLRRKDAVNDTLKSVGDAVGNSLNYAARTPVEQKVRDAKTGIHRLREFIEDTLGYPLNPRQQGEYTAGAAAMFLPIGRNKILTGVEIDSLGGLQKLEAMSEKELEALGLKRFEMPELKLERDDFSIKATVPGYPMSFFRAKLLSPGVVEATDLFSGDLPKGMGSVLFAEALKAHNALPTKRLILSGIINEETLLALKAGVPAENTLAARCATKALRSLGISPMSYKYQWEDQGLNIVIETRR